MWRGIFCHMAATRTVVQQTSDLMGGPSVLKRQVRSRLDFLEIVRVGLPWRSFELVTKELALPMEETTRWLRLSPRTLARRKTAKRFDPEQSERLLRLASVWTRACVVFGSKTKARAWLRAPSRALRGEVPLSLLDTDIGTQSVEEELVRIEYGVHA